MKGKKKPAVNRRRTRATRETSDVRRLVDAIFDKNDPVETGTRLLRSKADSTVAKIWALLLGYRYGKPVQQIEASGPEVAQVTWNFVTRAPRPAYGGEQEAGVPRPPEKRPGDKARRLW